MLSEIMNAWLARAGDAYLSSFFNSVLYAVCLLAYAWRWKTLRRLQAPVTEQVFWFMIILILFVLGVNKQLDLQVLLVEIGRPIARESGWYESRRIVQGLFTLWIAGMAGTFAVWMIFLIRRHWRQYITALLGLLVLFIYVIVETASQSHIGWNFTAHEKWGVRLTDLVEMTGILLILANAFIPRKKIL